MAVSEMTPVSPMLRPITEPTMSRVHPRVPRLCLKPSRFTAQTAFVSIARQI